VATVAEVQSCDGFAVEAPDGVVGWVEETWLDSTDHPAAFAIRTPQGRRALLPVESVTAVDPDTQEVHVPANTELLELDAPRLEHANGSVAASWRTTGAVVGTEPAQIAPTAEPPTPSLTASRASTARHERPLWQIVTFALSALVALISFEIGLMFLVAYLVTGYPPY
jgi:hypothetical protein